MSVRSLKELLDDSMVALEEMARARAEDAYGGLNYQVVGERDDYVEECWPDYLTPTARKVLLHDDED